MYVMRRIHAGFSGRVRIFSRILRQSCAHLPLEIGATKDVAFGHIFRMRMRMKNRMDNQTINSEDQTATFYFKGFLGLK
jgi:hypothetical protein